MAGKLINLFSLQAGDIVQLDDLLASGVMPVPPGPSPVPPGPTPPGPVPPGPTPPGPTPEPKVTVTLSIDGDMLTISATGDAEYVDGYIVDIFDGSALKKSYTTEYEMFDLSVAKGELPTGTYTVKARAYSDDGREFEESAGVTWECTVPLPACAPMTLRFKFSKGDYSPVDPDTGTAVTTNGIWTKLDAGNDNIWDWTYDNENWNRAFFDAFGDENNLVDVIAAGDTSGVTSTEGMFWGNSCNYYLRSCCAFDTSNVTSMVAMFRCSTGYYNTVLTEAPFFDTSKVTSMMNMFLRCTALKTVPRYNTTRVTDMTSMFNRCDVLEEIPAFDTSSVTSMRTFVGSCYALKSFPNLDTSNVTNMMGTFNALPSISEIPQLDYSSVTDMTSFMGVNDPSLAPQHMDTLPDISTLTDALTNCNNSFKNVRKVKYGILDAYNVLKACNPASHTDCFLNCGIDTEEGLVQLYQIPQDWGGLKPSISVTFKFHDGSYNPAEHQLGVGRAITGEDKYEQAGKKFSAEWICLDETQNIWMWGVTEGTNLSSAFVYGDGTGVGVPMLSGEDYITGIPEELTLVEGGTRESLMQNAEDWKYGTIDQEDWVPEFEIIDWDLENATDITSFIGTNVWYKNNLVGTLPALRSSSIDNIGYAFDRCWNVTAIGPINLPNCQQGANNAFMSMMGLEEIPEIEAYHSTSQLNNTFNGCLHASKSSIEDAYGVLSQGTHSGTHNCFKTCGIEEDPDALENIPVSWGGNATILGTNVNGTMTPLAAGGKIIRF